MKIENFINRIEVNRQFARSTVNSYTRILNNFNEYVKELYMTKIDRGYRKAYSKGCWNFISIQKIRWKSTRTCNWYLACIKRFCLFAERSWEKVFNYKEILLMKEPKKKDRCSYGKWSTELLNYEGW